MSPQVPEAEAAKIREEIFAGRKIGAIKMLRAATGLQLVDAKTVVEKLEAELRQTMPEKFSATKSSGCTMRVGIFVCGLLFVVCCALLVRAAFGANRVTGYLKKEDAWFASEEGKKVAGNVLSWQSEAGSWPKNVDTTSAYEGERAKLKGTFDNGATTDEIRFLGRAFLVGGDEKCRDAAIRGVEHILGAQYGNGGWPQSFPLAKDYSRHITFNDDAMVRLLILMREVSREERWKFLGEERRGKARSAFDKGVECILKCQLRDGKSGKLTAWCAQHSAEDFRPMPARSYELPSISGSESVGIVRLLMSIEKPSPEIVAAVEGAVEWFRSARIAGTKQIEVADEKAPKGKDKRIVEDVNSPGLWARFYEIDTGRAFFCDRDGVKKYSLAEIGYERRNGYAWYGTWPADLLAREYPEWKKRIQAGK